MGCIHKCNIKKLTSVASNPLKCSDQFGKHTCKRCMGDGRSKAALKIYKEHGKGTYLKNENDRQS